MQSEVMVSELGQAIPVSLEGKILETNQSSRPTSIELVALSTSGALLKSELAPSIGATVEIQLNGESPVRIHAEVKKYLKWRDSNKFILVTFSEPSPVQLQSLNQIVSYFYRLKKAGVRFE